MSLFRKAMVYLGLQDDDADYPPPYDDGGYPMYESEPEHPEPYTGLAPAPVPARDVGREHVEPSVRPIPNEPPSAVSQPRRGVVRPVPTTAARVNVVEPRGFNDAQEVGDLLKGNQPVILNLQGLGRDLQRRLIDFSSGLAYAVDGSMSRVADQVFLLTPSNVEVSQEEKERLQARGLYRA